MKLDIISRIYGAAAGEDDWSEVIEGFRQYVNADTLIIGAGNPSAPETLENCESNWNWAPCHEAGYEAHDTWDPTVNPAIPAGMIMPTERSFDHREIIPKETLGSSEFYQRVVYVSGYAQHRIFVPIRDASVLAGGFISKRRNRAFDERDIERLDFLLPHLSRAMRLRQQVARHKNVECGLSNLLDRMEKAVFLIDRSLKVLFCNGLAEDLARRSEGLSVLRGRLSLAQATQALRKAIAEMDADALTSGSPPVIPIAGPPGVPPLVARVYPGTGFAGVPRASRVVASVIVETQPGTTPPDLTALRGAFGLTHAEAAVARLVPGGASRRAIAKALRLSENTVKTHLASIRAKTGAGNMVALAMLLQRKGG